MMSQQRRSKQSNKTEKKDLYDIENCDEELTEEESSTRVGSASPSSPQRPVFDRMAKDTQRQLDGSLTSSTRKNRLELALAMCDDGDDTGEDASKPSTSSSSSEDKEKEEVQHHPNASSKKQEPLTTDSCFKRTTFQRAIHRGDGSEDESSEDDEDDDVPGALAIRGMGRNGLGANNDDEAEEAATVLYSMGGGENSNDGDNDNEGEEEPIIAKESNNEHLVVAELAPDIEVVEGTPMDGDEGDHNVLLMRRQQRRIRYLWISTLLAIIAVAILVGVFVAKNNNDDILSEESTTASTTFTTTIPPTSTDEEPNATNGPSTFSLSTTKPDTMQPSMDPTTETLMSSSPTILPSLAPTTSPSSTRIPSIEPTISLIPTTSSAPTTETMAKAMTMLSPYIPDVPRTAIQRQALDWLIQNDDGLINSTDEEQQDDNNNNNSASHRLLDRYVLAILYYSTHGEEWEDNTFWLSEVSVCTWYIFGFIPICPQVDGRVDNLDFINNNLRGTIPTEIATLTALTYLRLSTNHLEGTIPTQIGSLTALSFLSLPSNDLQGSIPTEIGLLTATTGLGLENNSLVGSIPSELGRLEELKFLWLDENNLTGTIPSELIDNVLTSLSICDLGCNDGLIGIPPDCNFC